jgi:NADH-quinone oxidoreductase subunit L
VTDDDDAHAEHHGLAPGQKPHETPWVVTLPLILLAIPSVIIGYIAIEPMLFGDYFKSAIFVDSRRIRPWRSLRITSTALSPWPCTRSPRRFLAGFPGVALSWFLYMKRPDIPAAIKARCGLAVHPARQQVLLRQVQRRVFAGGARLLGQGLWKGGDAGLIDGIIVNGSVRLVGWFATLARLFQTGHIYHYAFTMIIGVFVLMTLWVTRA